MQKITNISELRNSLLDAYESLKADPKRVVQVGALAKTAGKIISSAKLELEYAQARKEKPVIPFLQYKE